MYGGKGLGVVNTVAGISVLPDTGSNKPLFILAASLLVSGLAIFVAATMVARKSRRLAV
jgi:LPXTG-motif cell wall-anchored protein